MSSIVIHGDKIADKAAAKAVCPFGAIEEDQSGTLFAGAGCRMCRVCVRKNPAVFEFVDDDVKPQIDKNEWRGLAVIAEVSPSGRLHPVALELVGKARELAAVRGEQVFAVVAAADASAATRELLERGADEVHVYEDESLREFRIEPYAAVLEDFIRDKKPSAVLVGGTPLGRSLAPRVAARFRAGLTADCTTLGMSSDGDLDQIRPAYGGNIMAHIRTPHTRPQFATVRYKVFQIPPRVEKLGTIVRHAFPDGAAASKIEVLESRDKLPEEGIEEAEAIVVCGRGIRRAEDVAMLRDLASALGGRVAGTRAAVESGYIDSKFQIGLSGRTVKPKLIITCGVSGAIQFVSGMNGSGTIVAINTDPEAPIFKICHYGIVGDAYEVVPRLAAAIRAKKEAQK